MAVTQQQETRELLPASDRAILRDLASRVAEIAALPVMAERREMWKRHNRLERVRPMLLVFPEGAWAELMPVHSMTCESRFARRIEWQLRSRIYAHENFRDDSVVEAEWVVQKAISTTGWGLQQQQIESSEARGSWAFDPVINDPSDLKRLHFPEVLHDEQTTQRGVELAEDLFGDILAIRLKGIAHLSFHLMADYSKLRGLEQTVTDMVDNPGWLHDAMAFFEEGHRRWVEQLERLNLLSLNNDSTYQSSGGVGYTDELPQPGFDPDHVRPCDMWASAESQEMTMVSPRMHEEFAMQYEARLLEPFGLTGYGCCEDLTRKLDSALALPHLRRLSISPFADVERCAETLERRAIYSWKPNPAFLVGEFDEAKLRGYLRHAVEATRGNVVEMILKDTHTCEGHPERFMRWTEIARELALAG